MRGDDSRGRATSRGILLAVLVVAALLRLHHVDQPFVDAFGWRQASTAMMAENYYRVNANIFMPQVNWVGPGPSYQGREFQTVTYITALLYRVLGEKDWLGRVVAIAFGLWGIFALYQLIRQVWSEAHGLAGAAVMAVLPGSVIVERSFLPDPAQVALLTTSLWMLVVYCQTARRRDLVLATVAGTLGVLTKLPGAILVIPALYVIASVPSDLRFARTRVVQLTTAAAAAAIPVAAYYLWARHLSFTYPPFHFSGEGKFLWDSGLREWLRQGYFLPEFLRQLESWIWTWPFIAMVAVGILVPPPGRRSSSSHNRALSAQRPVRPVWLFHWWLLAMVARYAIEAMHLTTDPYNQHLMNPAAAAFAGLALVSLTGATGRLLSRRAAVAAVVAVLAIGTVAGHLRARHHYEAHYQDHLVLGSRVRELSAPSDLVILLGLNPIALYYSGRRGWVFPPPEAWSREAVWDYATGDIRRLESMRQRGAKWLLIPATNDYLNGSGTTFIRERFPPLFAYIDGRFQLVSETAEGLIYRVRVPH